jgi:alkylation response protein AidB-like acyl-CoA dehydrogenase
MKASKAWQAKKAAAGYAQITWPEAWGGPGGTPIQQVIFNQEEANFGVPPNPFQIGLGMCVPTVMTFADDDTKKRFVKPALHGEEIWCQLFSEPAGGSDVAAARTRAIKDGPGPDAEWVINGQKVWTTGAQFSDFGIVLVRTNVDAPKHKGLTMFWLDMKSPGVEVKPIHQMSGGSGFNEVYFTDVRLKDSQRLGAVDDGWKVALVTLMNERLAVGGSSGAQYGDIMKLSREIIGEAGPMLKDAAFREKLAEYYVQTEGLKFTRFRTMTALSKGQTPGPESSIGKIIAAVQMQNLANEAVASSGTRGSRR